MYVLVPTNWRRRTTYERLTLGDAAVSAKRGLDVLPGSWEIWRHVSTCQASLKSAAVL